MCMSHVDHKNLLFQFLSFRRDTHAQMWPETRRIGGSRHKNARCGGTALEASCLTVQRSVAPRTTLLRRIAAGRVTFARCGGGWDVSDNRGGV